MSPHQRELGHIVFGADPLGVFVGVAMTVFCVQVISYTKRGIGTKYAWI